MAADRDHVPHVEVQLGEDDLGQSVLHAGTAASVEALWVLEQVEGGQEEGPAGVELAGSVGQLPLDLTPLALDASQLCLELGLGPARLPHEVQVVLFLGVQLSQTSLEALLQGVDAPQLREYRVVELVAYFGAELVAQANGGVVLFDGFLDVLDFEVGLVAGVGLAASAQEIEVDAAVALAPGHDESLAAASAPEQALGPVVVLAGTDAATPA